METGKVAVLQMVEQAARLRNFGMLVNVEAELN
jgi:hypothetical protein